MKILLVGLGRWGKNHLQVLKTLVDEVYVAESDMDRLMSCEGIPPYHLFTDYFEALEDVDCVDVVTPADSHFEIVMESLSAGKDVFVEKPIAMTTAEAREMMRCQDGHILQVGHIYRYHPIVIEIKKILNEGQLGKIQYASAHFLDCKPPRKDVGVIQTDAIHFFDMFNYLFYETPDSVTSVVGNHIAGSTFDNVSMSILHYSDKAVHIEASCMAHERQRDFCIVGDKGSIYRNLLLPVYSPSPLETELRAFIDSVKNRTTPLADWKAGYNALKIVEACYESSITGRRIAIQW